MVRRVAGRIKRRLRAVLTRLDRRPLLVCHGHSFLGFWPPLIRGYRVANYGRGGFLTAETKVIVLGLPAPPRRATVVVEVGLNDARLYGAEPGALRAFAADLDEMRRHLGARGARVLVLLEPPIRDWKRFEPSDQGSVEILERYRELAQRTGPSIDLAAGWDVASMVCEDGVHPNDAGARHLAATVTVGLRSPGR